MTQLYGLGRAAAVKGDQPVVLLTEKDARSVFYDFEAMKAQTCCNLGVGVQWSNWGPSRVTFPRPQNLLWDVPEALPVWGSAGVRLCNQPPSARDRQRDASAAHCASLAAALNSDSRRVGISGSDRSGLTDHSTAVFRRLLWESLTQNTPSGLLFECLWGSTGGIQPFQGVQDSKGFAPSSGCILRYCSHYFNNYFWLNKLFPLKACARHVIIHVIPLYNTRGKKGQGMSTSTYHIFPNRRLQLNQKALTTFPDVVLVRVPTPSVQSDSDITVLRHLEKLGCRLVNRPQSILNCINKFWTFQELAGHGVPMPDTFSYGGHEDFSKMIDEAEPLGYPVVVKSTRGHRGKAVFLARDKHHLSDICHLIRHDVPYLFQKYVKESHGKDIRVVVVGGQVIGSMLRCSTDGRMQSNCSLGGVGVMCPLTEQGKQLAIQVSNILGMDFCGIDLLIMDDGSFVVCEANANVGFLAFDQACNLDVGGIIADYTMSLLPNRQTGKMAVLPGLSSPREKNEPDGCASAQGVAESVYTINSGSTSSESEPELGEIRDSSASTMGAPPSMLSEPGYNINNRIASELKLK
ncbi:PREDICTED: N-acetylaspartylglutamate synthase A [Mandrillus leucophaeus]|nr:PREDICTED: N-acetylaspartylglutamate synthase A [Mandrillus leucophaeus]